MQGGELPDDVQALLRHHLESFEQLELLLLLRTDRDRCWSEESLVERLRIPSSLVLEAVQGLASAGFLAPTAPSGQKQYRYRVQSDSLEATIDRLSHAYKEQPMPVIKLMSANAIERVRTAALRTFADAFVLRKDKNDG